MTNKLSNYKLQNRAILPLKNPILKTWVSYSHLLSIILNKKTAYDWLMNTFIQIRGYYDASHPKIYFVPEAHPELVGSAWDVCPFINKYELYRNYINNTYDSFSQFVIDSINNNLYIQINLDRFFIDTKEHKTGNIHNSLVYGYDLNEKKLFLSDNFNIRGYSTLDIDFQEAEKSFNLVDDIYDSVFLFMLKDNDFKFNLSITTALLKDYLLSEKTYGFLYRLIRYEDTSDNFYHYGIDNYNMIQSYLHDLIDRKEGIKKDWTPFTFLKDHKTLMELRISYLICHNYLDKSTGLVNDITYIKQESDLILNLFLKFYITNDFKHIDRISKKIEVLKRNEQTILELLVYDLEAYIHKI